MKNEGQGKRIQLNVPIFVYGTLRKGQPNFRRGFKGKAAKIIPAKLYGYEMKTNGGFPMIIKRYDAAIVGELIYVNVEFKKDVMKTIDMIEGYTEKISQSMYLRKERIVKANNEFVAAWVYVWNRDHEFLDKIPSGDWLVYQREQKEQAYLKRLGYA